MRTYHDKQHIPAAMLQVADATSIPDTKHYSAYTVVLLGLCVSLINNIFASIQSMTWAAHTVLAMWSWAKEQVINGQG